MTTINAKSTKSEILSYVSELEQLVAKLETALQVAGGEIAGLEERIERLQKTQNTAATAGPALAGGLLFSQVFKSQTILDHFRPKIKGGILVWEEKASHYSLTFYSTNRQDRKVCLLDLQWLGEQLLGMGLKGKIQDDMSKCQLLIWKQTK